MVLYSQRYGTETAGPPVVIIHGLFGDGSNWRGVAKRLSEKIPVIVLDLPNHGDSGHQDDGSFQYIVQSVEETLHALGVGQAHLLGHSIGGKVALLLALKSPSLCASLIAVDVAPKDYENKHGQILAGLEAISKAGVSSRSEADAILANYEKDGVVRSFLLKNLIPNNTSGTRNTGEQDHREGEGADKHYHWKFNRRVLTKYYDHIRSWILDYDGKQYTGPALFIRGELSDYIDDAVLPRIQEYCPNSRVALIRGSGHWVHAEKPVEFINTVISFLEEAE